MPTFKPTDLIRQQEALITITGTIVAAETATITLYEETGDAQTVVATATTTTIEHVVDLLITGIAETNNSAFKRVNFTKVDANSILAVAETPGIPFILGVSDTLTGSIAGTIQTENAGPHDFGCPENWSGGAVPTSGDDAIVGEGGDIRWGMVRRLKDCTDANVGAHHALASFTTEKTYRGNLGRDSAPLRVNVDPIDIRGGNNVYIDNTTTDVQCYIANAGTGTTFVSLNNAGADLFVFQGNVVCPGPWSTAGQIATCRTSEGANLTIESTLTISQLNMSGGVVRCRATLAGGSQINGGTLIMERIAATSSTFELNGGTWIHNSSGTINSVDIRGGTLDMLSSGHGPQVISANELYPRSTFIVDSQKTSITGGINPQENMTITFAPVGRP